ncbi:hypothetical protein [Halanaerobacter jeridensis]|uniref:Uncharacterized protein n=1 Tax=Halanaerobacter jeridensis TaxID=706427 RepID=A0A938XQW8_9FIRM|nr:hypothetical protein [Halanaerobacter jeridensis]MBM7555931.1 hypothetical protein [Halanaerobacter jeridensis]
MKLKLSLLFIILLVIIAPTSVYAIEVGGEIEVKGYTVGNNSEYSTLLQEKLNLELFLPETEKTEAKFEIDIMTDSKTKSNNTQIKKLYLSRKYEEFDLTVGRQPISWLFGSLLNPVDFNLGAETIEQESSAKNVDAVEIYHPFNWGSNLTGVLSTTDSGKIKYGVRARTTINGYDLTANFVKERNDLEKRIAATLKGDIGTIGVYGAAGHYIEQNENIFLIGADYSFYQGIHQIILQGEYLYDKVGINNYLANIFTSSSNILTTEVGSELVAGTINYGIDDFNTLKVTALMHLEDSSLLLIPEYESQLVGNLDLNLRWGLLLGARGEVFGPQEINITDNSTSNLSNLDNFLEITLSYPF